MPTGQAKGITDKGGQYRYCGQSNGEAEEGGQYVVALQGMGYPVAGGQIVPPGHWVIFVDPEGQYVVGSQATGVIVPASGHIYPGVQGKQSLLNPPPTISRNVPGGHCVEFA